MKRLYRKNSGIFLYLCSEHKLLLLAAEPVVELAVGLPVQRQFFLVLPVEAVLFMITHLKHSCYMICKRKKKV